MDVERAAIPVAIDEAGTILGRKLATNVLIIEPDPVVATDLEALVTRLGHRVIGIAKTGAEALNFAASDPPGLILAETALPDGGGAGLDVVNRILEQVSAPAIFVTAYPERFLIGDRPELAYLIAKPVSLANVSAVITQALFYNHRSRPRRRHATKQGN